MTGALNVTVIGIAVPVAYIPGESGEDTPVTAGAVVPMTMFWPARPSLPVAGRVSRAALPAAS